MIPKRVHKFTEQSSGGEETNNARETQKTETKPLIPEHAQSGFDRTQTCGLLQHKRWRGCVDGVRGTIRDLQQLPTKLEEGAGRKRIQQSSGE